jgi:hypothetical protein
VLEACDGMRGGVDDDMAIGCSLCARLFSPAMLWPSSRWCLWNLCIGGRQVWLAFSQSLVVQLMCFWLEYVFLFLTIPFVGEACSQSVSLHLQGAQIWVQAGWICAGMAAR